MNDKFNINGVRGAVCYGSNGDLGVYGTILFENGETLPFTYEDLNFSYLHTALKYSPLNLETIQNKLEPLMFRLYYKVKKEQRQVTFV